MLDLLRETATWAWLYVQHVVVMFYWFWIPAFLVVGILSARYRPVLEAVTLKAHRGPRAFWAAIGWGMTSGAGRRASLETAERLWGAGLPDHVVVAFLVASQNLVLYNLVLLTVLIGFEFGLGVFLGGLVMIGLARVAALTRPPRPNLGARAERHEPRPAPETWKEVWTSVRGWGPVVKDIGRYVGNVGPSLVGGLILGALILAIDTRGWWFFPKPMGNETAGAAIAGSFLAPLLSVTSFLAPGGNLLAVSSIWKTWTLAYSGLISFVLMSVLNPLNVRAIVRQYGVERGWRVVLTLYLAAGLGGLIVAAGFSAVGVEVTHVPWFRSLVDQLMMMFPGTMLGAPGGGMKGM